MMSVFISLYSAAAEYRLINEFRTKTSGNIFDTFETVSSFNKFFS